MRIGWLRSVYNINHAFAVQSFIAELAAATGRDPRDMLLEVVGPARILSLAEAGIEKNGNYGATLDEHPVDVGRLRRVIEDVTARAGWDAARKAGRAVGLAAHRSFLTYVAVVAAVSRRDGEDPRVDEVWITADPGPVVNLDRVRSQFEGAVIFGMSAALHGSITAKGGAIEQTNFRDYPIVRMGEAPRKIHVEILNGHRVPGRRRRARRAAGGARHRECAVRAHRARARAICPCWALPRHRHDDPLTAYLMPLYSAVMNDVTTTTRLGQFIQSLHAVEARLEAALEPLGLSLAKFGALAQLAAAGEPLPLSTLAERRACVRSNITQLVDRLEAEGLVKRSDDPRDRRSVRAELTDEGRAAMRLG